MTIVANASASVASVAAPASVAAHLVPVPGRRCHDCGRPIHNVHPRYRDGEPICLPCSGWTDPGWANKTRIELAGHLMTRHHDDLRSYLADLTVEISQREGSFPAGVAKQLDLLAREARFLEASTPHDFDDRRATLELVRDSCTR